MDARETLLDLARLAARAGAADAALEEMLRLIADALRADSGSVALLNPDTGRLETETRLGLAGEPGPPLVPGQGLAGWVALHAKPALAADAAADPRYRADRPGVRCQMAAPMLSANGQVLGVVTLDRDRPGAYQPADLKTLAQLTEAGCASLRRLWEIGHLRGKARQLETLVETGQALVAKVAPQELLDTLTRDARLIFQARGCALFLCGQGTVQLSSYCGEPGTTPASGELPADSCLVASAIRTRRAVSFGDIRSPESLDLADLPRDPAVRSVLTCPLACEAEILGVLAIYLGRVHRFDNDEKRLACALAGLGAVALQNTRLYGRVFEVEETLRKNERLTTLGLLSAEIAHEIRNPLTVLKLLHGGLGADLPEGDPRRTDLRVIGEKLDQLEGIVTRVLGVGRAPEGLQTPCSLAEIVEDTLLLVRLKLAQGRVRVRYTRPERPLVVRGRKGQLQQVLLNLIINSLHAMPDGGEVAISVGPAEGCPVPSAVIEVADTGSGVPEAIRPRLFDSFLSGRPDGTGLGLAIARRIVESHRGEIALNGTGPRGTAFRITLPLAG